MNVYTSVALPAERRRKLPSKIYIGTSTDGEEIMAMYGSRREAERERQPDEVITGPWVRERRASPKRSKP